MLSEKKVDAFGVWEPSVELGVRGVGEGKVKVWGNGELVVFFFFGLVFKEKDVTWWREV